MKEQREREEREKGEEMESSKKELKELREKVSQLQADLVELLGDVEVTFKVPTCERVKHAPVHQVIVKGLGVLRQAHIA